MDQPVLRNKNLGANQDGFFTLIGVLLVTAVGLTIAVSLLFTGIGSIGTGLSIQQSYQAQGLASACVEEALQLIKDSMVGETPTPYTGTGDLSFGEGSCTYTVLNIGGSNMKITASGLSGDAVRKEQVTISSEDPISVSTWKEVADFD